jgi:hypothetical protein
MSPSLEEYLDYGLKRPAAEPPYCIDCASLLGTCKSGNKPKRNIKPIMSLGIMGKTNLHVKKSVPHCTARYYVDFSADYELQGLVLT